MSQKMQDYGRSSSIKHSQMEKKSIWFHFMGDSISEAVFFKNLKGQYIIVNNKTLEILGLTRQQIIGKSDKEIFSNKNKLSEFIKDDQLVFNTAKSTEFTISLVDKNKYRLHTIKLPWFNEQGSLIGLVGIIRDITGREETEEQLRKAQTELRRRERVAATGALASGVAHEIRNPLNIIGMTVEYLQSQLKPHDSKRELTEAIIEKVERLDRVTRELSSFGRARQLNIKKENLRKSLNLNFSLIKFKCRTWGVKLKKEYSNLPLVEMDSAQMDKVFLNIMDNAIEAMPAGGVLTVSTEVNDLDQMVIIKIHNTGIPIPKKHLAHIFEPFYTVKKKGTGLGLAIAHKVMLEHKGQLKVKNEYGRKNRGVTFIIQFPIHPPPRETGESRKLEKLP